LYSAKDSRWASLAYELLQDTTLPKNLKLRDIYPSRGALHELIMALLELEKNGVDIQKLAKETRNKVYYPAVV
jgi:hypothetical protein